MDTVNLDTNTLPPKPQPPKLGGWLLIIYILLFLAWLRLIQTIIEYSSFLNDSPAPEVRDMVVFNIILSAVYIIFILYLLVIMAMKKRFFVKSMIAFLIFTIVINIVTYFLFKSLSPDIKSFLTQRMITAFIACVSFMAYFLNSERVRTTFIL
jgi:hypothetical protein